MGQHAVVRTQMQERVRQELERAARQIAADLARVTAEEHAARVLVTEKAAQRQALTKARLKFFLTHRARFSPMELAEFFGLAASTVRTQLNQEMTRLQMGVLPQNKK